MHSIRHKQAAEGPGGGLSKEGAMARAEKFLREEKKIDLSKWSLVESNSDKRPHRTDHTLTWQQSAALDPGAAGAAAEHAFARIELVVLGDEVTDYRTYIKIPDEGRHKPERATPVKIVFGAAPSSLVVVG